MRNHGLIVIVSILFSGIFLLSCNSDNVGDNYTTFTEDMMGRFIENDTSLIEFNRLMDTTKVKGLLNAYGYYTCFAPSNSAMKKFYKSKGKKSIKDFTADTLLLIAYDHIINKASIESSAFPVGRLPYSSMSDRYITASFASNEDIYVNKTSIIISKDNLVHNGVVHIVDKVLDPVRSGVAEVISKDTLFSLFSEALSITGLADSLQLTVDASYNITDSYALELENAVQGSVASERHAPRSRRYGYTVLMESNKTMESHGIKNLADLKAYAASVYDQVYPQDAAIANVADRRNSLNRFVAYHLIDKEISYSKFVQDYYTNHQSHFMDLYEYIETMCPNTLLEVKMDWATLQPNRFNTNSETGKYISIVAGNYDNDAANGVYHEIDNMLVYSADVEAGLSSKRLRFDFASLFPELTNNNMRGRATDNNVLYRYAIPSGYLARLKCANDKTVVGYTTPNDKLMNYEGDEFFIAATGGNLYDFTVTTLPVPAGTYEVRFGYQSNGRRGVAQFYVDGVPTGVPVNLNTLGTDALIGYVNPGDEASDPNGYENDKMMRNRGYMKGPNSFKAIVESWYAGKSARYNSSNLRKILGTYRFSTTGKHEIMVRGLSGGQFQIDFIEFVPTSSLESEDIN
ncbi:MAG: hypothetical protein RIS29_3218 [Bacteroidota bacterium]|jgi:uncharacterized surface protein with fasciclin (FAS1) repeats